MSQQSIARSPAEIYQVFQTYVSTGKFDKIGEVVDLQHYTENCVGLTGWTTGFDAALKNWMNGFGAAMTEIKPTIENVIQDREMAVFRLQIEAKHTGPFLGIPPTGRTVSYDMVDMFRVKDGKIVWRWVFIDLHGITQQIQSKR